MSDQSTAGDASLADDAGDGDAAAAVVAPQAGTSSEKDAGQESADARIARLESELAQTRREAASRRTEARDAKQRADQLEQAQMTEAEKATRRADEAEARALAAEAKLSEASTRSAVYAEAEKHKAVAPSDVYAIVRDEISSAGDDADIPGIVKAALESRPHLIRALPSTGGAANGGRDDSDAAKETDADRRARIYGGGSEIFNADAAIRRGGGVVIPGGADQVTRR